MREGSREKYALCEVVSRETTWTWQWRMDAGEWVEGTSSESSQRMQNYKVRVSGEPWINGLGWEGCRVYNNRGVGREDLPWGQNLESLK